MSKSPPRALPPLELPPEVMRRLGYGVIDHLVERWSTLAEAPVARPAQRSELESRLREPVPRAPSEPEAVFRLAIEEVFTRIIDCCHPRNFSWVPSPANFVSILADALTVGHNVSPGIWMEAAGPSQVELLTVDWLRELCGLPEGAGGIFTSGGSAANLTALMTARTQRLGAEIGDAVIYQSDQTHASLSRNLRLLGFRPEQCHQVASDAALKLDPAALSAAIAADLAGGRRPFCVVANAGTTNAGVVDPLGTIADICREHGLWLHVDGAYGAAAILTERGRVALAGLERVDSLSMDPHKWLFQPIEMGCCLVRDADHLTATFSERPEYLRDTWRHGEVNFLERGIQFTRTARAIKLWMSLKVFGLDAFRDAVDVGLSNAELAQEVLDAHPRFEVVTPAQLGIITFRYVCSQRSAEESDALTERIFQAVMDDGYAFLTTTLIGGRKVLRLCTINPRTTADDIRGTIAKLAELADEVARTHE